MRAGRSRPLSAFTMIGVRLVKHILLSGTSFRNMQFEVRDRDIIREGSMVKTRLLPIVAAALLSASTAFAQTVQTPSLPDGDGKQIVETACSQCHKITIVTNAGFTPENWLVVMRAMVHLGAKVPPDQFTVVTDYLAKNFPKKAAPKAVQDSGPKPAPPGAKTDDGY
jgi:hypothetical protein